MKLPITITNEGLNALVDARAGRTTSIQVGAIGLSSTPFVMAPTLDSLPGEIKRIDTVSGMAASETLVHFVATDDSTDTYTVTGLGLFLTNGDLFGVYSMGADDGPIFQKSEAASFLFAADIAFQWGDPSLIQFGNADFVYPPATTTIKGVAYLANDADVYDGTDDEKIVTPKKLSDNYLAIYRRGAPGGVASLDTNGKVPPSQIPSLDSVHTYTVGSQADMLALPANPGDFAQRTDLTETFILTTAPASTLANWVQFLSPGAPVRTVNGHIGDVVITTADTGGVPVSRQIVGEGLVKGGGDLSTDRGLNVDIATAAETLAGAINDKAVTPASLASVLAQLAAAVATSRHVDTAGLATGGGDLTQNRTITVTKASAADVEAMTADDRAITPAALAGTLRQMGPVGFIRIPGTPLILQWGYGTFIAQRGGTGRQYYALPTSFPNACWHVYFQPTSNTDDGDDADEPFYVGQRLPNGFYINLDNADCPTISFDYLAIGM